MRYFGLGLAAFTLALVALLSANGQPVEQSTEIPASTMQPHWTAAHSKSFTGCVSNGSFVPARIVVVARGGAAKALPYNEGTIARIDATWETPSVWDDLYTIGRCAR